MPLRIDMTPQEYLEIIRRRKWSIIFSFLFAICYALYVLFKTPLMYRSSTTIMIIPQKVPDAYLRPTASTWIEERLSTIGPLVMSRTRLRKIIDEYGLYKGTPNNPPPPEEKMIESMRKRITIEIDSRNDTFSLAFVHEDPMTAMLITQRLASFFLEENLKTRESQAQETLEYINTQLKEAKANFDAKEEEVRRFKYRYLDELPGQADALLSAVNGYERQLNDLNGKLKIAEDRKANLEIRYRILNRNISTILAEDTANNAAVPETSESSTTPVVDTGPTPQAELVRKKTRLYELSQRYTDSYPEIRQLKVEIRQLEEQINSSGRRDNRDNNKAGETRKQDLRSFYQRLLPADREEKLFVREEIAKAEKEVAALKKHVKDTQENILKHKEKLKNAPKREQEHLELQREYDKYRRAYEDLNYKKIELTKGEEAAKTTEQARILILDPANLPKTPFSPDVDRIIKFALLGAIALGFGSAFGLEALDTKIRGAKDFKHYCNIPILAALPVIRERELPSEFAAYRNLAIALGLLSSFVTISILAFLYLKKI